MSGVAIRVEGLGKSYQIGHREPYKSLRDTLAALAAAPFRRRAESQETFWALRNVSFEIGAGEVVGIVGRNGAGKSTLLRILSRITRPTEGRVEIRGRVGSLLEVGTGFHPELTGRENIFLSGAILGMRRTEIVKRFDTIVDFAEIERFLDTPVKRYSSGMYVRLAFAVAAHLEPEILLVDEVLAVGDAAFQKKCLGRMGGVAAEGRTVFFVSHNLPALENLCPQALLFESGVLARRGETRQVIREYLDETIPAVATAPLEDRTDRRGTGRVRFTEFHLEDADGRRAAALRCGEDGVVALEYKVDGPGDPRQVAVGFGFYNDAGQLLFVHYTSYKAQDFAVIPRRGTMRCRFSRIPLLPGRYRLAPRILVGGEEADWPRHGVGYITVEPGDFFRTGSRGFEGQAAVHLDGEWSVVGES